MASYRQINHALRPFGDDAGSLAAIGPWTNATGGTIDGAPAPGLGVDLTTIYQTNWPGVVTDALQLWAGAQPLVNAAQPQVPLASSSAPPLLQAPAASPGPSPIVLVLGAAALYYFLLK